MIMTDTWEPTVVTAWRVVLTDETGTVHQQDVAGADVGPLDALARVWGGVIGPWDDGAVSATVEPVYAYPAPEWAAV